MADESGMQQDGFVGRWLGNRPVVFKLLSLAAIGLAAMVTVGATGLLSLGQAAGRAAQMNRLNEVTRITLEADQAHDAIRGDVLRALVAKGGPDATAVTDDLAAHIKLLTDGLATFRAPTLPADVRAAAEAAAPGVEDYVRQARLTVTAAQASAEVPPGYDSFTVAFHKVEQELPRVAAALQVHDDAAVRAVHDERGAATRTMLIVGAACLVLLGLVARLVTRSIVQPLRRVAVVTQAVDGASADSVVQGVRVVRVAPDAKVVVQSTLPGTLNNKTSAGAPAGGGL